MQTPPASPKAFPENPYPALVCVLFVSRYLVGLEKLQSSAQQVSHTVAQAFT